MLHTKNVYLIESHVFGTTCARVGCMPSKLLIAAAESRHHALHTDPFGVHLDKNSIEVNGVEVMNRVKSERDRFVGFVVSDVEEWDADKRIMGAAKFIDEHTVQIDDHTQITADRIVIATGSRPVVFPQWEALGDKCIINDDVFSWDTLPESVAVFGAGVIGLELGQALKRLGVNVEIFSVGGAIGGISDPVVSNEAKAIFGAELPLHLDAKTEVSLNADGKVEVKWEQDGKSGVFVADYLLAAAGRRPNVDNIVWKTSTLNAMHVACQPLTRTPCKPAFHIFSLQAMRLTNCRTRSQRPGENAISQRFTPHDWIPLRKSRLLVRKRSDLTAKWRLRSFIQKNQGRSRVMLVNQGHLRVYAEKSTGKFLGAEMVGLLPNTSRTCWRGRTS
ncbi:Dihydrolipoamide dehydrogenase [Kingella kingae]|nr:Dihydrolipoamide dehydrogenase [Kingella kingae]